MTDADGPGPGFFGKVRTRGDFVSRRLPPTFTAPWDASLQRGMVYARDWFATQWLAVYLNAPLWNFAIGAGVCGASAWVGVLMPGVDRVGRFFPFTVAAPVRAAELAGWLRGAQRWYDDAARFALSTLAADFVLERFDAALNALQLPGDVVGDAAGDGPGDAPGGARWRLAFTDAADGMFADRLAAAVPPGQCAWWSEGSDAVPATLRIGAGLPDAAQFAGLLDASCPGWETVVALTRGGDGQATE
ncbi:type VI secretion system-associated protein TagF [Burkholderia sp. MR1-5-21]